MTYGVEKREWHSSTGFGMNSHDPSLGGCPSNRRKGGIAKENTTHHLMVP